MIANYHTHTWRCRHADGTEREYVERAIEGGLKILGFSDHSPYPFPDGYDSGMRMRLDQVEGYVDTVLALKKEYDKDIEIHLGLETEYFPRFWDQLIDFLSDYPFEYFVLGQHSLAVGLLQKADAPQQGGLAGPAAAQYRDDLPIVDTNVNALQHLGRAVAAMQILYFQHGQAPFIVRPVYPASRREYR